MIRKLKLLLSAVLAVTLIHTAPSGLLQVHADETYPMACGNYEVAYVTDQGTFSMISCHDDFEEAKNIMYANGNDAVVRHPSSKSPTKIIAMSSGIAASYSYRRGHDSGRERRADSTMDISQYEYPTKNEKVTYVTSHREMNYKGTYSYNPSNGTGRIKVNLTGFDGFANLDQVDLIPMKFFQNGLGIVLGGNNDGSPWESPFRVKPRQSFYEVVQNGSYRDIVFHAWSYWANQDIPQDYSTVIGPALSWMNTGDVYYTNDMHQLFTDRYFQNPVIVEGQPAIYYNYYQFLPMRSRTVINGDQLNGYLNSKGYTEDAVSYFDLKSNQSRMVNSGWYFVNAQETYGVNALMTFSMGLLESGWGRSNIAITKNNLFGWNAVDSSPGASADAYPSIEQAVTQHMAYNLRGYLDINDARFFGMHLGNKGSGFNVKYASDPYWGLKIAGIAYDIDKYVSGNNGTLTEYGRYDLGVITEYGASVKRSPDASSSTLFTTQYGATYQNDFTVILEQQVNGWSRFPTPNGIRADGTLVPHKGNGFEPYDWNNSAGYLSNDKIQAVNGAVLDPIQPGKEPSGEPVSQIREMKWNEDSLEVHGQHYRPGIHVTETNPVIQQLFLVNSTFDKTEVPVQSEVSELDHVLFSATMELKDLPDDRYYFEIQTHYGEFPEYDLTFIPGQIEHLPEEKQIGQKKFTFTVDQDILFMDVVTEIPEPEPTPETDVKPEIEKTVRHTLKKFEYTDEKENILHIEGNAFINGYDFKEDSQVTHSIILTQMETGKETVIEARTSSLDQPINMYDGYTYSKIAYQTDIDLDALPMGSYLVKIRIAVGDTVQDRLVTDYHKELCPEMRVEKDHQIRIIQNQMYSYRYEINKEVKSIDYSLINKPTRINSAFNYSVLTLDQGKLNLDAKAWIRNVDFDEKNKITHSLIAVDAKGKQYPLKAQSKACKVDYTEILGSEYSLKNICFDSAADLSQLPAGTYQLYVDVSTSDARDIYELSDVYEKEVQSFTEGKRTYSITISPVRYRMELTITEKK